MYIYMYPHNVLLISHLKTCIHITSFSILCYYLFSQQKQLEVLQYECELVKELKKEAARLREKLSTMEG